MKRTFIVKIYEEYGDGVEEDRIKEAIERISPSNLYVEEIIEVVQKKEYVPII